jgi:PKD repeat protein
MSATATWQEDEIEVTVTSDDLPDGAMVGAWAVDHDDLSTSAPLDSAETDNVHTSIEDGKASITLDAADFAGDTAVLEVSFISIFDEQPQVVRDRYWPNQGAAIERLVRR